MKAIFSWLWPGELREETEITIINVLVTGELYKSEDAPFSRTISGFRSPIPYIIIIIM